MSAQLKSSPSALPPQPSASDQSVDDISDIGDSDSDDDLSHVFDDKTTILIPRNTIEAKILSAQAKAKRKIAMRRYKLADAEFRKAASKAKRCRARAQHAKRVLDATDVYVHQADYTIQQTRHHWSKFTTVTDSGQNDGTKVCHFANLPDGKSMCVILD